MQNVMINNTEITYKAGDLVYYPCGHDYDLDQRMTAIVVSVGFNWGGPEVDLLMGDGDIIKSWARDIRHVVDEKNE